MPILPFWENERFPIFFAGEKQINCTLASEKLAELFDIKTLMVSGGGVINWAFLKEQIVDEVSIVVAPVTDGLPITNTIFENKSMADPSSMIGFNLKKVEIIEKDTLWLRYKPINQEEATTWLKAYFKEYAWKKLECKFLTIERRTKQWYYKRAIH